MTRKGLVRIIACAVLATAVPVHAGFISVSNTVDVIIPDATGLPPNSVAGVATSDITVANAGLINSLTVTISMAHPWVGELVLRLAHGGTEIGLLDRPGIPPSSIGSGSDLAVGTPIRFSALAVNHPAESMGTGCTPGPQNVPPATVGGAGCEDVLFAPDNPFTFFVGKEAQGLWRLTIRDEVPLLSGSGLLDSWTLNLDVAGNSVPEPGTLVLIALGLSVFTLTRPKRRAA